MMQLLCKMTAAATYEAVDLYEDTSVQFTHDNPLFAFDDLKCERTTQFKLPSTPTNDRLFTLSRLPQYDGRGMRVRYTAQLQMSAVAKSGYLYISQYDGKDYNAVFVTGELVGLQALKDLGKIGDFMTYTHTVRIGTTIYNAPAAREANLLWANVKHFKPSGVSVFPSVNLARLYTDILTAKSITGATLPTEAAHLWLVSKANGIDTGMSFKSERTSAASSQPSATPPSSHMNTLTLDTTAFERAQTQYGVSLINPDGSTPNRFFNVLQFSARTALTIEFPEDWPATMYVYDLSLEHEDPDDGSAFYGGRGFTTEDWTSTTQISRYGTPLAGRSIELQEGDCFSFVDESLYSHFQQEVMGTMYYNDGFMLNAAAFDTEYTLQVRSSGDLTDGSVCRLQDNLPECTFVELLKIFAAVSGRLLYYTSGGGISFDECNFSTWSILDLSDKLMNIKEVKRTFGSYAQTNKLRYNSTEDVREPIEAEYTIDNVNLEHEKELQTIPFSEGDFSDLYPSMLYMHEEPDKQTLAMDATSSDYLLRVPLKTNAGLQALCDASTQIKISARMSAYEYEEVTPKTLIYVQGARYVWTSKSWQKEQAQFTLAKIE